MTKHHRWRARIGVSLTGVIAIMGAVGVAAGPAAASTGTDVGGDSLTVTPSSNLISGGTVSVSLTTVAATPGGVFIGVTQCGNADSSGTPLASLDTGGGDCEGAAGLGSTLQIIGTIGVGAVPAGINTVSLTLQRTGLGANNAQCIAMPPATLPCTVVASPATAAGAYTGAGTFQVAAPISYRPPATASITSVTGQNGTSAARAGNTINLTGSNWDDTVSPVTGTMALCSTSDNSVCDATGLDTPSFSVTGGVLTASAVVDASATTGARNLVLTESSGPNAVVPVTILGNRQILITPVTGGAGTSVTVTGSGYNASVPVAVAGVTAGSTPTSDTPTITMSSATGAVSATFTVNDPNTVAIAAAETSAPLTNVAIHPFVFSGNNCVAATANGCSLLQTVSQLVKPGVLTFSQTAAQVAMSDVTLNGENQTSTGQINQLTVSDARGSLVGWTVTATATDLSDGSSAADNTIPAGNLKTSSVTCAPDATAVGGILTEVTAGAGGALSKTVGQTLCQAPSGGGGGTFDINADLSLLVPASVASGTYTSTMTFTVQ